LCDLGGDEVVLFGVARASPAALAAALRRTEFLATARCGPGGVVRAEVLTTSSRRDRFGGVVRASMPARPAASARTVRHAAIFTLLC